MAESYFHRPKGREQWQRLPLWRRAIRRTYNSLHDYPVRWLCLAIAVTGLTWGVDKWANGDKPLTSTNGMIRRLVAEDQNPIPGDLHLQRTTTPLLITRASTWSYHWGYNCGLAKSSRGRIELRLVHMAQGPHGRVTHPLSSRAVYSVSRIETAHPVSEIATEHGAGAYRFVITIPRACIWAISSPPLIPVGERGS